MKWRSFGLLLGGLLACHLFSCERHRFLLRWVIDITVALTVRCFQPMILKTHSVEEHFSAPSTGDLPFILLAFNDLE